MSDTFFDLEDLWLEFPRRVTATAVPVAGVCVGAQDADCTLTMRLVLDPEGTIEQSHHNELSCTDRTRIIQDSKMGWSGILVDSGTEWIVQRQVGDDEPAWFFEAGHIRPGEYVAIRLPDRVLKFCISHVRC